MFGSYRTVLALAVVASHIARVPLIGTYAIHGFFILSGYLMTLIMHETYGYSPKGLGSFAINRFLRLIPIYWITLAICVTAIAFFGESNALAYRSVMFIPRDAGAWLQNLFLVFPDDFPWSVRPRLVPATWALTVELFYYALIAFGISRNRTITWVWFAGGLAFFVATFLLGYEFKYRHGHVLSGSLPFATGALIYHYLPVLRSRLEKWLPKKFTLEILLGAFLLNAAVSAVSKLWSPDEQFRDLGLLANLVINAGMVILMTERPLLTGISRKVDSIIGDFSYPLYLTHWIVGFSVSMVLYGHAIRKFNPASWVISAVTVVVCAVLCALLIRFIDVPVQRLRQKFKKSSREGRAPATGG